MHTLDCNTTVLKQILQKQDEFARTGFMWLRRDKWWDLVNTRSTSGASLPESANGGQIDHRVVYCLLIYIMLSGEDKYLKIIIYHHLVIYFVMFYTYDVSNRPIPGNIADE